jgi:hypothetical protein
MFDNDIIQLAAGTLYDIHPNVAMMMIIICPFGQLGLFRGFLGFRRGLGFLGLGVPGF